MYDGDLDYEDRTFGSYGEDRPQPHDLKAEKAVLSSMMMEPSYCVPTAIAKLKSEKAFYSPVHRVIFKTIFDLTQKNVNIDFISLSHALKVNDNLEDIGGEVFIAELENYLATTANIEEHCKIVKDLSDLREMIDVCVTSTVKCYDLDTSVEALMEAIEGKILEVRRTSHDGTILPFKELLKISFQNIQAIINKEITPGIETGFVELDKKLTGMKPGEMIVLAARPSIGKTSLALNILRNISMRKDPKTGENQYPVAFFSLEMTSDEISKRLISTQAQVPIKSFSDSNFSTPSMQKLKNSLKILNDCKIFIDDTAGLSLMNLRSKARRLKTTENIQCIIIDYLQLMKSGGKVESRQLEIADISGGIKELAKELKVPILVLAQLNRELEKGGPDAKPKLSHLRDSGSIEQDADVVMFLHRNRDDQKDMTDDKLQNGIDSEIIIEKNRNGETANAKVKFFPQFMEFRQVIHRYDDEEQ